MSFARSAGNPSLLLSILVLVGLRLVPGWEASAVISRDSRAAGEPTKDCTAPLRVMTFNLRYSAAADGNDRWELRREQLVETIRSSAPDILGTQECLAGQAEFLREALPDYEFVGVGREDGRLGGEMCAIFYRRSLLVKLDAGHFWLSETPQVPGSKTGTAPCRAWSPG